MKIFKRFLSVFLLLSFVSFLNGCSSNATNSGSITTTVYRESSTSTYNTSTYTVGGTVSGLAGIGLILQNNYGDNLIITSDGSFVFATALADGSNYNVTILTHPAEQSCTVSNGSGTIAEANVTNVTIRCTK